MTTHRGDVVVRLRVIQEGIASAAAAMAGAVAHQAADAVRVARSRAAVHPLANSKGPMAAAEVMTAVGVANALRETALTAERRSELAEHAFTQARDVAHSATAHRKAAERLAERREQALEYERQRRQQRVLDENAAVGRPSHHRGES